MKTKTPKLIPLVLRFPSAYAQSQTYTPALDIDKLVNLKE